MFFHHDREKARQRNVILRAVYHDNLKILGKQEKNRRFRISGSVLLKLFIVVCLSFFIIIVDFQYPDPAILPVHENPVQGRSTTNSETATSRDFYFFDYGAFLAKPAIPIAEMFDLKVRTIIIDPGHGGDDRGAVGLRGTEEKDITLDIARRLRIRLEKHSHFQIYMTREDDTSLPLTERIEIANSLRSDLYISIHVNYVPQNPINLIETYYFGPSADHETLRLAEMENSGSQYRLSDFKEVLYKIGNTIKLQESKVLASAIQKSLYQNISRENRETRNSGIKTAPFAVLLGVDMPSVLTEVSCLSNAGEEEKLMSPEYREGIARYLEEGILNYLSTRSTKGDIVYEAKSTER